MGYIEVRQKAIDSELSPFEGKALLQQIDGQSLLLMSLAHDALF